MDSGEGRFEQIDDKTADALNQFFLENDHESLKKNGLFKIGEALEIKGSEFVVKNITRHGLSLKLVPNQQRVNIIDEFKKEKSFEE